MSDRTTLAAGLATSAVATPTAYVTVGRLDVLLLYGAALPLAAVALYTTGTDR